MDNLRKNNKKITISRSISIFSST